MKTLFRWRNAANRGPVGNYYDAELSPTFGTDPVNERIPALAMLTSPRVAFEYFNDFFTMALDDTTANPTEWKLTGDHNTVTTFPASLTGGVLNVACGDTDNDETYLQLGQATTAPFVITTSSDKPLWFEARVKAVEHADEGIFIGLAEEGASAANFMADNSAALADKDLVGFNLLTASPTAWNTTWRKNGQAVVTNAGEAGTNADDWHVFGFYFDGESTVTFYADGVACATVATTSAATFASGEEMSPIIAVKTGEAVAKNVQIDYIRVVQAR